MSRGEYYGAITFTAGWFNGNIIKQSGVKKTTIAGGRFWGSVEKIN